LNVSRWSRYIQANPARVPKEKEENPKNARKIVVTMTKFGLRYNDLSRHFSDSPPFSFGTRAGFA